jgi:dTDP-4-dehydrorhamnose reductase
MANMNILITGANGLLGQYLVRDLSKAGYTITATGRGRKRLPEYAEGHYAYIPMDITNQTEVTEVIEAVRPAVIVHAAAMTQPDACELNKEECRKTNVLATSYLAAAAAKTGSTIIYLSTDFVFDGKEGPYKEDDIPAPVNYYGESKLAAEKIIKQSNTRWAIVRTVLVYGNILAGTRSNVVTWVKDNLEQKKNIKVVDDQIRTPTYVEDLSRSILLIIQHNAEGIYHISGREVLTPYQMAVQVADYFSLDKALMEKVNAATFSQPAQRPLKTGFVITKAEKELGFAPVDFREGIRKMFP